MWRFWSTASPSSPGAADIQISAGGLAAAFNAETH